MIDYKEEHVKNGENKIHACSLWDKMSDYSEWLELLEKQSSPETLNNDWTVHTNFIGVRKSNDKL